MREVISSNKTYWRLKMSSLWTLQGILLKLNGKIDLDKATEEMLLNVIKTEESWVKSSAVWTLGMSQDKKYAQLYIDLFQDWSDRVTNAAAIALGKTKSPFAYDALMKLKDKPSWKNQSLISALNGFQWLGDDRALDLTIQSLTNAEAKHWTLGTPIWDHRLAAAQTLKALSRSEEGYDLILEQLNAAIAEDNLNDIFYNLLQITTLADKRGATQFERLREKYKNDNQALNAISTLEGTFNQAIK